MISRRNSPNERTGWRFRPGGLRRTIVIASCCFVVLTIVRTIAAGEDPVKVGRDVFRDQPDIPWYDAEQDQLRPLDAPVRDDDPNRSSRWQSIESAATNNVSQASEESLGALLIRILVYTVVTLIVASVIIALIVAALRAEASRAIVDRTRVSTADLNRARMENLPLPLVPSEQDLLSTARSYYEAGEYGHAATYYFAYQLVELDRHHLIRLSKGKTNRQYLRELRTRPQIVPVVRNTMKAFEDFFFGHHELTRQRFEACWQELSSFHSQLEQATG